MKNTAKALIAGSAIASFNVSADLASNSIWWSFQNNRAMIDKCALRLVDGRPFDRNTSWPAYCNDFENTQVVNTRVSELRKRIEGYTKEERELVSKGLIKIGLRAIVAESSWGYPDSKNNTTTYNGTIEQWIYDSGPSYLYIENGLISAIQN